MPNVEGCDSLVVARTMQLGKTKAIKHSGGVASYCRNHLNPNLSQWKEGSHNSYLWIRVSRGVAPNLLIYVVCTALVGSKHKNKLLFQNLAEDIIEVQTLMGIILLGRDFNARITALPDTIDTTDVYELLHVLKLAKTK